jgi:hypothetical protein
LLDRKDHKKYGIRPVYNSTSTVQDEEYQKFTIEEIFRLTPDPAKIIKGCKYRYHDYDVTGVNSSDCYSLFNAVKYLAGAYICYVFNTRERNSNFDCSKIPKSPRGGNVMYLITLVEEFVLVNKAKFISFVPSKEVAFPLGSRRFASTIYSFGKDSPYKSKVNYVYISGDLYVIHKLPKPYDTRCTNIAGEDEYSCSEKCSNDVYAQHRLVSPLDVILKPNNFRPFLIAQKDNESLIQEIKRNLEKCSKDCHRPLCFDWYSVTQISSAPFLVLNSISIASTCSNRPTTQIVFTPKITIIDYVVYLSGCYGIWFGVSVISLNPFSKKKIGKSNAHAKLSVPFRLQRQIQSRLLKQNQMKRGRKLEQLLKSRMTPMSGTRNPS